MDRSNQPDINALQTRIRHLALRPSPLQTTKSVPSSFPLPFSPPLTNTPRMAYRLSVRIINDTGVHLDVIEKSCWKGAGTAWTRSEAGRHLSMNSSGSSGMLRIRSSEGEHFVVALGVHNYKRWCDVDVNLTDSQVLHDLHEAYYNERHAKYKALWAQATEASGTSSKGRKFTITFYRADGNDLLANLVFN